LNRAAKEVAMAPSPITFEWVDAVTVRVDLHERSGTPATLEHSVPDIFAVPAEIFARATAALISEEISLLLEQVILGDVPGIMHFRVLDQVPQ